MQCLSWALLSKLPRSSPSLPLQCAAPTQIKIRLVHRPVRPAGEEPARGLVQIGVPLSFPPGRERAGEAKAVFRARGRDFRHLAVILTPATDSLHDPWQVTRLQAPGCDPHFCH